MQIETSTELASAVDTNEEYIIPSNAAKEPAVFSTVFKAIIVETIKDFFKSIIGFFLRYIRHFVDGFRYFWSPSLKKSPFDEKDYKENCQHSFELTLLVMFAVIFMVKLDWIPPTDKNMMSWLNNDISQMGIEFMMFLFFGFTYLFLVVFSIVSGRLWRALLKIRVTRRESDILFCLSEQRLLQYRRGSWPGGALHGVDANFKLRLTRAGFVDHFHSTLYCP